MSIRIPLKVSTAICGGRDSFFYVLQKFIWQADSKAAMALCDLRLPLSSRVSWIVFDSQLVITA